MLPLAPRPFSQMARRDVRLYGNTLQGLRPFVDALPWYAVKRRRPSPYHRDRARACRAALAEVYREHEERTGQPLRYLVPEVA